MQFCRISARLLIRFHIITTTSETRTYPGSKVYQQVVLDGKSSFLAAVTSGVPQGTVLGPLLFLVYINARPSRVSSSVQLFAGDCLPYRVIRDQKDVESIQTDLSHLQEWQRDWHMVLNPDKCEHIWITNKRNSIHTSYNIHRQNDRNIKSQVPLNHHRQ